MKNQKTMAESLKEEFESLPVDVKRGRVIFPRGIYFLASYATEVWDSEREGKISYIATEHRPLPYGFQETTAETYLMWDETALRVEYPQGGRYPFTCKIVNFEEYNV
jgi:hypothetical protein